MKLHEMIAACREDCGDNKKPYLVSDTQLKRYANRVESMAARQSRMLVDSTSEVCAVSVMAGEPVVDIDSRIISIRRARFSASSMPLAKRHVRQMDMEFCGWETSTSQSTPFVIVTDYGINQLRLYPIPKADGEILLTVTREPLHPMEDDEDEPEISPRYHESLVSGMKYIVMSKEDSDLYDKKQAELALAEFVAEFGPVISAVDERYEFENYDDIGER